MKFSEIVGLFGDPVYENDGVVVRCPSHDDTKPSLRLAVSSNNKLLVKCRAGCATSDVVAETNGLDYSDLFDVNNDLADFVRGKVGGVGESVSVEDQATLAKYLIECTGSITADAFNYANVRFGATVDVCRRFGIGFDPGDIESPHVGSKYHASPRLVIPFYGPDGVPGGFQSRIIDGSDGPKWSGPHNPKSGGTWRRTAYFLGDSDYVSIVVCEGPGDALAAAGAGVDAVGIRGVSHAPAVVEEFSSSLVGRRVVLAADNDAAGASMNKQLGEALSAKGLDVHVMRIPSRFGDVSEWCEKSDSFNDEFVAAVIEAERFEADDRGGDVEDDLLTALGVARMVAKRFDGLVHCEGLGFFVYSSGCWRRDELSLVRSRIHAISDELVIEAGRCNDASLSDVLMSASRKCRTTSFIDQIIKELRSVVAFSHERFDSNPWLLGFRNGVVDLKTGELLEHSQDFMLTKQIDVDFDATAQCPRWQQFLLEIMSNDQEMVDYLQRLVGYGLTGLTSEQCLVVLYGRGANGKSVFTDTISKVFRDVTQTTPFETFEARSSGGIPNDLAALHGARLVFASEGGRGRAMAESVIKRLTGQDQITARFMRQEFFTFYPSFLIILATNHKPNFKGQDDGLWRRVKLVPFARVFKPEERDHYLIDKLVKESAGIAAWAVRGAIDWHNSGLGDPDLVISATKNYRATSDILDGFFPGVLVESPGEVVCHSDVFQAYLDWANDEQLDDREKYTKRGLAGLLTERGLDLTRLNGKTVFKHATLTTAAAKKPDNTIFRGDF